ncbi:hypothetical protein [Actinomadura rubrisoli]|uniref:Uncharacterized protein n=1 Tax=Actinomadura rubrisoli TaxID=2530368 RepID=A0A4R5CA94_9ACTN|nr:hypothetical protein [Actinomadura rubrisoli]TDD96841.1 hypothetical protein E1298_02350 [Actinomadura rubrisoli]
MATITMEWALWSERPGARDDYTVLSCSRGKLRPGHFKRIITRFSPGTAEAPADLPRVTIITVDVAHEPHIGLAIQTQSDAYDGTGRRIAPTQFFLFPYNVLEGNPLSYYNLYQALHPVSLPEAGEGSLLHVDVPGFNAATVAADLARLGAAPTSVAARLLHKERLCVTGAEQSTTDDRLRYLDAAVSLLPYGYRAKITATTWANGATRHILRMCFSRRAGEAGMVEVPWEGSAADLPVSAFASRLDAMLDRFEPTRVIGGLAYQTAPQMFDDPHVVYDTLGRIEKRLDREHGLRQGNPTLADLREWLDEGGLPDDEAEIALRKLLPKAQSKDIERIAKWLPVVAPKELKPWWTLLAAMSTRLLWKEGARLAPLLRALPGERDVDKLLATLVKARPDENAQLSRGLDAIAQLLATQVAPDPGTHPSTEAALTGDGPVALALVYALLAGEAGRAEQAWGRQRLPAELMIPLDLLLRLPKGEPVNAAVMEDFARHGDSCVAAVLNIASLTGRLDLAADGFIGWLLSGKGCEPAGAGYWGSVLSGLTPADHRMQAMIDVVLLATSHRPRWMMEAAPEHWPEYEESFEHHWSRSWPNRNQMIIELAHHLRAQSWHDVPGRATDILSGLLPKACLHENPTVEKALIESLSNAHDLSNDLYAEMWLDSRGVRRTAANPPVAPPQGSDAPPREAPSEHQHTGTPQSAASIVEHIVEAVLRGESSTLVYDDLSKRQMLTRADVAVEVVASLAYAIASRKSLNDGHNWTNNLVDALCEEKFGPIVAQEFKKQYLEWSLRAISDQIRRLRDLNSSGNVLDDNDNAAKVRSAADVLLTLVGDKPKGHRRKGRRGRDTRQAPPAEDEGAPAEQDSAE